MIRTALSIKSVPSTWIFEHYCKLSHRLHGQDVKIKSIFNESDTQPSMVIYYSSSSNAYCFKDFSSGKGGDAVTLVAAIKNLNYNRAITQIVDDYKNRGTEDYEEIQIKEEASFKVTGYTQRKWNQLDAEYWPQFGISSRILTKYNVRPFAAYKMSKEAGEDSVDFVIKGQNIYGYFKDNGDLYKVYQPKKTDYKFINILPYIQGTEQLNFKKPTLVITSSLKDIMALRSLNLDVETIAPQSENTLLSKGVLAAHALRYEKIVTLFDNDKAGHQAMSKYEEKYGIPGVYLNLSKDLSDSIKDHGSKITKNILTQILPK